MNPYYWLGYHLSRVLARLLFRFRIIHRERMIQTGPVILAMNHQSYLDPPLAGNACDRAIYFLAKKTLLKVPLLRWLLPKLNVIPVDQEAIDRSALKALIRVLIGFSGRRTHIEWQFAAGPARSRSLDREDARSSRADADFRRARSAAAWRWRFTSASDYNCCRRADLF